MESGYEPLMAPLNIPLYLIGYHVKYVDCKLY